MQNCRRCGHEHWTTLKHLSRYCSECSCQEFTLTAETKDERATKKFSGQRQVYHRSAPWKGKTGD